MNILDWLVDRFDWRIRDDLGEERAAKIRSRYAWNRNPDTPVYASVLRDIPAVIRREDRPPVHPAALRPHPCPRCRRFSARSWTASDALGDRRGGVCAVHGEWEAA